MMFLIVLKQENVAERNHGLENKFSSFQKFHLIYVFSSLFWYITA